jgi:hypothetical protein
MRELTSSLSLYCVNENEEIETSGNDMIIGLFRGNRCFRSFEFGQSSKALVGWILDDNNQ